MELLHPERHSIDRLRDLIAFEVMHKLCPGLEVYEDKEVKKIGDWLGMNEHDFLNKFYPHGYYYDMVWEQDHYSNTTNFQTLAENQGFYFCNMCLTYLCNTHFGLPPTIECGIK